MKKIKIFLGSSITEFETERNELELFIRNISDRFEDNYNIKIVPLRCENMDNHIRRDGTQSAINEELVLDSDMCFFIFFTRAGEFTQQEFEVAFEKFRKDGKPKIYIYFKNLQDGEKAEDSVREFMNRIDNELSHYHGVFDHIDTIKLRILLNLKLQEMDFVSVEFENGKCVVDGKNALDISNVSEFANNALLQQLQKELAEIEEEYLQMKPIYVKGGASESFCRKYAETASKRQNLIDTIEELQKNIFNMSLRICKDEVHGEITARQKEAYRRFELGDYEGCMAVLDSEEIDNDFFAFEKQEEQKLKKRAGIYIKEHKTAIDILMTMVNYKSRFNEIEERYEKIVKVAEKYKVELYVVYDYAIYLKNQNKYKKALQTAQELERIYEDNPYIADNDDKSGLYNLLGLICNDMSSMKDSAEHYLKKAIEIREELAKENPDRFNAGLAMSYNNAGLFYDDQGNAEKAEYYYKKAIEIMEELAKENPDRFYAGLATSYNNAGVFYNDQGKTEKAGYYYKKATEIYEELAKENPDRFNADLAMSYNNAGVFYYNQGNAEKAGYYLKKTIEIREELAKENPDRFNSDLASSYNNAGIFYYNQGKTEKAEYYYKKAIEIREELAKENPDRFNSDLAESYISSGVFYDAQGNAEKADYYYKKAIEIREELAQENPDRFNACLAMSYNNAGGFYDDQGNAEKADYYYKKAIRMYVELAKENPNRFNADLAMSYNNAGVFYYNQGNAVKAEYCYKKAIEIYEKLAKENPDRYNAYLAESYNNAGNFYDEQGNAEKTEYYYKKAIEIREGLAKENPDRFNADLANIYYNAGIFYDDQGNAEKTEYYYKKAIGIREKLAKENPDRFNSDLANSYNNAGLFYDVQGNAERAEYYYKKAIEIYEELAKENPDRFNADLARSYNNAGAFYNDQGDAEKAGYYYKKTIEIREELAKENPDRYNTDLARSYFYYALLSKDNQYLYKAYQIAKHYPDNIYCKQIIDCLESN